MDQSSIHEIFSKVAAQYPSHVALERSDRLITYRELEEESNRLANFLIASGVSSGSIVAIMSRDPARVVTAILAILKARCAFAPFDPLIPDNRLRVMVEQITPRWFIIDSDYLEKLTEIVYGMKDVKVICSDGDEPEGGSETVTVVRGYARFKVTTNPAIESDPDDMCSIFFTSGSTGKPKGIAGRLKGIAQFALWESNAVGVGPGTRVSQLTSPSFDGILKDVFVPLCAGGTVCIPKSREITRDAKALVDWLESARINLLHCVPSVFRSLINIGLTSDNFPALRHVVLAGEPLLTADVSKWFETFGDRIQLVNLYGPTETTLTKLAYFVKVSDKDRRSIPIGKPMPGAAAVVIDAQGRACAPGEVGEILIRTPYRAHGYYNQPEKTAEVFVPNPFNNDPNDIVYRTGDYGRVLPDGNFEFVSRKDHQVKIRGVRIELTEIENVLRAHESVTDVAVIDREDAIGNKYLCAYVVLDGEVEPKVLRQHMARWLPDTMMPSALVRLDALPHTINGKVDRKSLPAPGMDGSRAGTPYVAPRTAIEEVIANIWAGVLGVERVGVTDSFFDLGGHSLLATQVISRVRSALRVDVGVRQLFESPTVGDLAASVEAALKNNAATPPPIERASRTGPLPLSFAQQRLWFLDQLEPGSAFYNVPAAIRLSGRLDVAALGEALQEIVRRHETLRTWFRNVNGEPEQFVAPALEVPFDITDFSSLAEHEREARVAEYATEWSCRPFDLEHGPLVRARLLRLGEEEHVLLFCMHHIVGDLWSVGVLVREWGTLYQAFSGGQPSPLEPLPVQYADYAVWQRQWLHGDVLEAQLDYWRKQIADAPTVLNLPTDRPRGNHTFEGARLPLSLPSELSIELEALSRREGATLFMTLLTAFGATLHYQTRQNDILIGTPIANRQQLEVENLIGFFLNTLVLRLNFAGDPSFRDLLRRVRETALRAYAHQDVPFEKLVETLRPERSLHHNPLFQVAFTLDQVPVRETRVADLTMSSVEAEKGMVQFDLVLHLANSRDGVIGTLQYQTGLFEADTMKRFREQFENVLRLGVARPEVKLSELCATLDEIENSRWANKQKEIADFGLEKLKRARRSRVALAGD
ncbi:MAG TPA: amino acid adenylation domain-containing protein [Pyrinomonadaceae bacterium]